MNNFKITSQSNIINPENEVLNPFLEEEVSNPFLEEAPEEGYTYPEDVTPATWDENPIREASEEATERRIALNSKGIAAPGQKSRMGTTKVALSTQDMKTLQLLALTSTASIRQVATVTGTGIKTAQRRMRGLERMGAVWHFRGANGIHYYGLTSKAISAVSNFGGIPREHIKKTNPATAAWEKLGHTIAVAQATANLMAGRYVGTGEVEVGNIISEYAISSAMTACKQEAGYFQDKHHQNLARERIWDDFHAAQKQLPQDRDLAFLRPELLTTIAWDSHGRLRNSKKHGGDLQELATPDIVLLGEDMETGTTTYHGIEVELTPKNPKVYRALLESYFSPQSATPLTELIYITSDPVAEKRVREAAQGGSHGARAWEDYTESISFLPLLNLEGQAFYPSSHRDYWNI